MAPKPINVITLHATVPPQLNASLRSLKGMMEYYNMRLFASFSIDTCTLTVKITSFAYELTSTCIITLREKELFPHSIDGGTGIEGFISGHIHKFIDKLFGY